jgi:bacteriocin biosynthesis cyclodehydratase domain-containing protein
MASAIPMKCARAHSGNSTSLGVVGIGPFGDRVAAHLMNTHPGARLVAWSDIQNAFAVGRSAVVVALWRPEPLLCEKADELAHRHGLPWLPVTMEHPVIRIGPLVWPRCGPCFRCYRARREQHDTQPAATAALLKAYEDDSSAGPGGYLPHQARMAAAIARQMLGCLAVGDGQGEVAAGQVTTLRLLGGGMSVSRVIACHDCRRCGGPPGPVGNLPEVLSGSRNWVLEPCRERGFSSGERVAP